MLLYVEFLFRYFVNFWTYCFCLLSLKAFVSRTVCTTLSFWSIAVHWAGRFSGKNSLGVLGSNNRPSYETKVQGLHMYEKHKAKPHTSQISSHLSSHMASTVFVNCRLLWFLCIVRVHMASVYLLSAPLSQQTSGGPYRMKIYERPDFQGQMMEFSEDCDSVQDRFRSRDIYSCNVMEGYWTMYEHPSYRGRQYFMRPGEYRKFSEWGATCATTGSFRRITDF